MKYITMKGIIKLVVVAVSITLFTSCQNNSRPNYQYMPNMYQPVSYETYGAYPVFPNEQSAMVPVEGTIARGHSLFEYGSSNDEYLRAKAELMSPLDSTQVDLKRGGQLFDIYCGICHGPKGDGQGNLVKREKILGVPKYNDAARAITQGSIYHTLYYGKNAMGSYKNLLSEEERWQVVAYVLDLKQKLDGAQ